MDSTTNKYRRPVKRAGDNTDRIRRNRRADNQNNTSSEAYSNYTRLLQLFPYFHPVAIDRIFANCNRDFIRTIDNLLYIKRYFYSVQTNDWYPHTTSTTDPSNVTAENKQNHTNTDCNIAGIREQIRVYEEHCSLTEYSLDSQIQYSSIVDSNFHTSTPQVKLDSGLANEEVTVPDETCYLQFALTNYDLMGFS
ncbi:hypothetical protein CBL_07810 [Carabus blaptoides fortunei]